MENERNELIDALLQRTQKQKIRWEEISDDSYRAKFGSGMVRIEREVDSGRDVEGDPFENVRFKVWVISDNGGLADVFEPHGYNQQLKTLFETARHSAMNTPRIYKDLLQELRG